MGGRRIGFFDIVADKSVIAMRKVVTALIAVEGGRVGADVDALSCAPVMPITFSGHYFDVTGPKVVTSVRCVLHDG